jgi:phosphoribosylformylglycinamidine synthase PurS subunit
VRARVLIRPKDGVLDPQGEAVRHALGKLGFAVADARVGRLVELELQTVDAGDARAELEQMCDRLLANPLIEAYDLELE